MSFTIRAPVAPLPAFAASLLLLLACAALGGCNDVAADPPSADAQAQFVAAQRRQHGRGDGRDRVGRRRAGRPFGPFQPEPRRRPQPRARIAVVDPAKARYLVRGYLTATPIEGGTEVDLVWDVFTPDKRRAQRLSDAIAVRGAGDDAWAMIGDAGLDSVAAKSADDLAAYLSNTPEAAPAGAALSYAQ